jgi:alcohol dehydrogenase YqhD (iron-dependent ADH family)
VEYKIICFDLDNTLCNTIGADYESSTPKIDRINKVNELYDSGVKILIETARGSVTKTDWYELTKSQLEEWGVKYHELRTGVKLNADLYVDDKGINDIKFF